VNRGLLIVFSLLTVAIPAAQSQRPADVYPGRTWERPTPGGLDGR
jgi:hypothetical protein